MRNRFVFIDESGVIGGVSQPLFVLGALKIADTAALTHGLTRVRSRVCGRHGTAAPRFEFRFSAITERTAGAHSEAVALLCAEPEWELRVVVFDKVKLEPDLTGTYGSEWDAQVGLTVDLVREIARPGERLCVLRDAVSRPSTTHVFFEKELERLGRDPAFAAEIFGAVTMESHASLLIQLVDVVVGAVRHAEARRRGYPQRTGTPKAAVADEVLALLTRHGSDQGGEGVRAVCSYMTIPFRPVARSASGSTAARRRTWGAAAAGAAAAG
ncbi:MAG: DUF3800 domain-containing protein [Actinomycetes bacterium]